MIAAMTHSNKSKYANKHNGAEGLRIRALGRIGMTLEGKIKEKTFNIFHDGNDGGE